MTHHRFNSIGSILVVVVGFLSFAPLTLRGQASLQPSRPNQFNEGRPASLPVFAVATVKPARNANGMSFLRFTTNGLLIQNFSLQEILREAFGMESDRIVGLPGWAQVERFDVDAKVDDSDIAKLGQLTIEQRPAMLVPLLVDRFNLKFHHEQRDLPIYNLVVAKGGPKLKESNAELAARYMHPMGAGHLEASGTPLTVLARYLSRQLGRTVYDKTGLTGRYDYTLQWTPDNRLGPYPGGSNGDAPDSALKPDLFTALREQLGLKLESQKEPTDVVVIDHISKVPSEN